jgi:hypothetical protein
MPRFIMALAAAFLLGVTIAGCSQVTDLRTSLLKQSSDLQSKPSDIWRETAESGGE